MTHSVIRLTELTVDPNLPLGYAPTANQLVLTNDERPLNGHLLTTPIVRDRHAAEGSGAPATPQQRDLLRAHGEDSCVDTGLVIERVHGEVTLPADLETMHWLMDVRARGRDEFVGGGVISVEVWQQFATGDTEEPGWHASGIRLLHLRDLFGTFTGDVLWFEQPAVDDSAIGPTVLDWGYYQRMTKTPPPSTGDSARV